MYYTLRREYFWPKMVSDVILNVRNYQDCIQLRKQHLKHQSPMKLFLTTEPLAFVAMELLGPLQITARWNFFFLVVADRSTKTTRCIPLRNTTEDTITAAFLKYCAYAYGVPHYVLKENRKQLIAKFLYSVCGIFSSKTLSHHILLSADRRASRVVP